jgi:hypothetical protein
MVVTWAIDEKGYSQRRACALIGMPAKTYRYVSSCGGDTALRERLRALSGRGDGLANAACTFCSVAKASSSNKKSSSGSAGRSG